MFDKFPVFNSQYRYVIVEADAPAEALTVTLPARLGECVGTEGRFCTKPELIPDALYEPYPLALRSGEVA
nr:hypothetical protein [uncultured Pseudogulbenkiania sp.]